MSKGLPGCYLTFISWLDSLILAYIVLAIKTIIAIIIIIIFIMIYYYILLIYKDIIFIVSRKFTNTNKKL